MHAIIVTPYLKERIKDLIHTESAELLLCADTAYLAADAEGITSHIVIGDFDHGTADALGGRDDIIRAPCEKDDTDTMLCIKHAIEKGADKLTILGGIGGRLDHTFANLQALAYAEKRGVFATLKNGHNEAFLTSHAVRLPKKDGWYLSVFAYDGACEGVSIRGTKYEVENVTLDTNFPLGVSNEITADLAEIGVKKGRLLVILSKKD